MQGRGILWGCPALFLGFTCCSLFLLLAPLLTIFFFFFLVTYHHLFLGPRALGKFVVENLKMGRTSCSANLCSSSGETFAWALPSHLSFRSVRKNTALWSRVKHSLGLTGPSYFKRSENILLLRGVFWILFKIIMVWVNKINDFSGMKTSDM